MTSLELLQEIDAWLSFNNSQSKEQISELRNDIKKHISEQLNLLPVRERLINYLNGRIRLIQSKYEIDECDERIMEEIVDIRTDVENNSF